MENHKKKFKEMLESLYADLIEDSYDQLKSHEFVWPEEIPISAEERLLFLKEMLEYFEEKEEFEKCEELQKMRQSLV